MPTYKPDFLKNIADLTRTQSKQFSSAQQRAPLTKASAGWVMPNYITPQAPADGAHIYVVNDEMRWKSASGADYSLVPVEVPSASAVTNAGNIVSGNAPATYNDTWGQNIYEGLVDVKNQLNAALSALRAAGLMDN